MAERVHRADFVCPEPECFDSACELFCKLRPADAVVVCAWCRRPFEYVPGKLFCCVDCRWDAKSYRKSMRQEARRERRTCSEDDRG